VPLVEQTHRLVRVSRLLEKNPGVRSVAIELIATSGHVADMLEITPPEMFAIAACCATLVRDRDVTEVIRDANVCAEDSAADADKRKFSWE